MMVDNTLSLHMSEEAEPPFFDVGGVTTGESRTAGRRNLPRASHACQRCRAKKGKCNQQQPCSNCIKYATSCVYGIRRKNGRNDSNDCVEGISPAGQSDAPDTSRHSVYVEARYDAAHGICDLANGESVEDILSPPQSIGSVFSGMINLYVSQREP